jgi:AraC family transcriptional regulator, melibiose operon regulatory protein
MNNYKNNNSLYNNKYFHGRFFPEARAYYFKVWNDFKMQFHAHDSVEIMYVINGDCLVETKEASFKMMKGEFMLLDANIEHRLQVEKDKPCRMLNVEFDFTEESTDLPSFGDIIQSNESLKQMIRFRLPYVVLKNSEEVYVTLKSLIMELDRNDSTENTLVYLLFDQLLIKLSRLFCEENRRDSGPGIIYVKKAVLYMHQNYNKDIQIKDIAAAVNVHPGYLHRIFKNNKGCTIMDYLTRIRIEKAKSLLANTDIQITDLSDYIGISSRQYFSFVFKKHTGLSPSLYRKSIDKQASKY